MKSNLRAARDNLLLLAHILICCCLCEYNKYKDSRRLKDDDETSFHLLIGSIVSPFFVCAPPGRYQTGAFVDDATEKLRNVGKLDIC